MGIYKIYFKKYKWMFVIGIAYVFLESFCNLLQPTIMARIIDDGVKSGDIKTVVKFGVLMLIITTAGAFFAITRSIVSSRVSQNLGADLKDDLFRKIMDFSEKSADKIDSGSLITRMTNDASQITQFVSGLMRVFIKAPVTCIGSIILSIMLSPKLSVVLLIVVALVSYLIVLSMKLSYSRFAAVQRATDKVNTVVQEYLMGVRLVKAFGRQKSEEDKFETANENLTGKSISSQIVISYFSPLITLAVNIGIVIIIYFGSVLFRTGDVAVGEVSAFINYMGQILLSLIMMTNIFNILVRTKASTQRLSEILDSEDDFPANNYKPDENEKAAQLDFKNVSFAYPSSSGLPAINDLSFSVNRGETLAVIGPTGSGKSTLAWLCLRFYDVDSGTISISGRDIKSLGSNYIRGTVAVAPQQSMLFSGTVYENIWWGNQNASQEDIRKAAISAQADGFINEMPQKYDSIIGQSGRKLSGGQKQRISIARALVSDSEILILDDCTSALDSVTEAEVLRAIADEAGCRGRTVILITQRIGTASRADKVLVLENGKKVGFGGHDELIKSCGVYREIYDSQIGGDI
jgi:ATP-binding cassette subfamily B protein